MHPQEKKGFSLIEMVVYAALLASISVWLINASMHVVNTYFLLRAEREVMGNARVLLEGVTKSVAEATDVYAPTSRFESDTGQLSLLTLQGMMPEHTTAYLDFWVDNGRLWTRKEGQVALALSSASVRVSQFRLERITQSLGHQAVKITLRIDYARLKFTASTTVNATTALRGNY